MSKHKVSGKDKKKGSQLVIRIDKVERDAFVALCDRMDTSAAREIRRFMREQVAAHAIPDQANETAEDVAMIAETADAGDAPHDTSAESTVDAVVTATDDVKPTKKKKR
jgi:Na+-translocating ferredoxin:NAD+ oxidoreductase RNF subunit RnfB